MTASSSVNELERVTEVLRRSKTFALDVETAGLTRKIAVSPRQCRLTYIGIGTEAEQFSLAIKSAHREGYQLSVLAGVLSKILDDPDKTMVGHNLKFDLQVLAANGIKVRNKIACTQVAAYLLLEDRPSFRLKTDKGLMAQEFDEVYPAFEGAVGGLFGGEMEDYLTKDIIFPLRLWKKYKTALQRRVTASGLTLYDLFDKVEMPVLRVLCEMESAGITVDIDLLDTITEDISKRQAELRQLIYQEAGREFNIRSNDELAKVLYTEMGLPAAERNIAKTQKGWSTAQPQIEKFPDYPIVHHIIDLRKMEKLKGTYTTKLAARAARDPESRVYTSFNQTVTATGRLSSSNPNLQNIPSRSAIGQQIRATFIAADGCQLVGVDFGQIELRMVAHYGYGYLGYSHLGELMKQDKDLHSAMVERIWNIPYDDVVKGKKENDRTLVLRRGIAKNINFGFCYGMGAEGFVLRYRRPVDRDAPDYKPGDEFFTVHEAKQFRHAFFEAYPEINGMHAIAVAHLQEFGEAYTITGRTRHFKFTKGKSERELWWDGFVAWNHMVQGGAQDVMKIAMRDVHRALRSNPRYREVRILLQVHDELIIEAPDALAEEVRDLVADKMINCVQLHLPITVDAQIGKSWADIH